MASRKVRPSTLVGVDRGGIYKTFADEGFTIGCEVGVREGLNARVILDTVPGLELLLVDPYMVYEFKNRRSRNKWKWHKPDMDTMRTRALKTLAGRNVVWLMTTSHRAAEHIEDESLDFVYIDGNHAFDYIMEDILLWGRKIRKGGIVSGHDYGIAGVRRAVDLYAASRGYAISITDRQLEPGKSKTIVSWMFRKE